MKVFFLFLFCVSSPTLVYADYRVFILKITKPNPDKAQPPIERSVQSTLDPNQYPEYYPVDADEKIEYTDTWRCTGRTGEFQDYCPKPAAASSQKAQIPDPAVSK